MSWSGLDIKVTAAGAEKGKGQEPFQDNFILIEMVGDFRYGQDGVKGTDDFGRVYRRGSCLADLEMLSNDRLCRKMPSW